MSRPALAKSLHTHSVLVNLALHLYRARTPALVTPKTAARECVADALRILQLSELPDVYGLTERAREHVAAAIIKAREAGD